MRRCRRGLDIEAAADAVERFFVDVDNSDVVAGNGGEVLGDGRADLAAAENKYFHGNRVCSVKMKL